MERMNSEQTAKVVSLSGHHPQDVIELIRARARSRSRADGHRLALALEGGSLRGVYSAGALLALHIMGMEDMFDNAYASSAGAVNIAHFLSGVGDAKADTYYRFLADRRFFNPWRVRKVVDIDFFVDEVLTKLRPVEIERVMQSVTPLWIAVADFVTARPLLLHAQAGDYPLLQILKAATALPILYNKLVDLGAVRGFDAGFINPIPLDEAFAHGNTHVLVLLPRPERYILAPYGFWEQLAFDVFFAPGNRQIQRMYKHSTGNNNRLRDVAHGRATPPAHISIATISPVPEPDGIVGPQDSNVLRSELIAAARGTLRLFGHAEDQLDEYVREGKL